MSKPPPGLATFDSASAMARTLSNCLKGTDFPALGQPPWRQYPVSLADWLPRPLRERLFAVMGASEGVPHERAGAVRTDRIAEWFAGLYPRRRYPVIAIGSSNGALIHLYAALGAPWLPQTFLILIKQKGDPDDAIGVMEAASAPAREFLAKNSAVELHHMHDPSQDRLMAGHVAYFRPKFLKLPSAYRSFIEQNLEPGGTIVVAQCERSWPTTRLGDRHLFQFGALGGPTVDEYFQGGPNVEAYLSRYHSQRRRWDPPAPAGESPEAEWGFQPALLADITALAMAKGCKILRLRFKEPCEPSPAVADFYRIWLRDLGRPANRLLAESFILLDPHIVLRTGSVPFWMKFNMQPSLAVLQNYLNAAEPYDYIHLMLFAHGVDSPGLPSIEEWKVVLRRARKGGTFAGVDESAYPAHFAIYGKYHSELKKIPGRYPLPRPAEIEGFREFMARSRGRYKLAMALEASSG